MWKLDPVGHFTFDDRSVNMLDLGAVTEPNLEPLRAQLLREFSGRTAVGTPEIKHFANVRTLYRPPHLTTVLKALEKEKVIVVHRPRPRAQFGDAVTVDFPFP